MASLPNTITIEMQLRPCRIIYPNGIPDEAVFHKWVTVNKSTVHPEANVVMGIVEFGDGSVVLVEAEDINFIDGLAMAVLAETDSMSIADDTPENKIF